MSGRLFKTDKPFTMHVLFSCRCNVIVINFLLILLVVRGKATVLFAVDLEVNLEVLEIVKQAGPTFIEEGQDIFIKHE